MTTLPDKAELRRRMERLRGELPDSVRFAGSSSVCRLAAGLLEGLRRQKGEPLIVFSYLPYRGELDVRPLLEECRRRGDTVLAPRIDKALRRMVPLRLDRAEDAAPGSWGVPEPKKEMPAWPENRYGEIDVVLVPGLAFDRRGGRLGYGGGFYDRFMEEAGFMERDRSPSEHRPQLWAAAFDEQVIGEVPLEAHDFRLDLLITPTGAADVGSRMQA